VSTRSMPEGSSDCALCRRSTEDDQWPVVFRSALSAALVPSRHTAPGSVLVVPLRHVLSPLDLTSDEAADLFSLLRRTVTATFGARNCDYYHISQCFGPTSGEPLDHIHWRVEPRMAGVSHPFRPFDDIPPIPVEERVAIAESLRAADADGVPGSAPTAAR
jgi:diadenosine tetraphosphate (Ap4A) HIT family hydrolase